MDFHNLLLVLTIVGSSLSVRAFEQDLTVDVGAGKMECFYQQIKKPGGVEIEYQVIDGGDLDINFFIQAPDGRVLISEHKKTDNFHKIDISTVGDMKVCLDNSFSHFASKLVFFELVSLDDDDNEEDDEADWAGAKEELAGIIDMTLEEFRQMMDRIGQHLDRSKNLQTVLKMYEARDRNIVEQNFDRVNFLSSIQLFIMLSVGLVQVLMIRSLFGDSKKASGIMKAKT